MWSQEKVLRVAFLVGAVTDALAILPMLLPPLANLLWGFEDMSGAYQFAMGYGASLMLGWTALLIWAYQKPMERKVVAALTVIVIYGLVLTEVMAVLLGHIAAWRMRCQLGSYKQSFWACLLAVFTMTSSNNGASGWPNHDMQSDEAEPRR
jgi:hypothetical protein